MTVVYVARNPLGGCEKPRSSAAVCDTIALSMGAWAQWGRLSLRSVFLVKNKIAETIMTLSAKACIRGSIYVVDYNAEQRFA